VPRYRFLLLDADRTLFDFDAAQQQALTEVLEARGLPAGPQALAAYRLENQRLWDLFEQGGITKEELLRRRFPDFLRRLGLPETGAEELNRGYLQGLGSRCIPMPGAEEVCRLLAQHCKLYIVTNGISAVQRGRMARCTFRDCFGGVFVSEELGCQKPQPEYFRQVARRIPGFDPAGALVVGDSLTSDIAGANAAGLESCWYNPAGLPLPAGLRCRFQISSLSQLPGLVLD